MIVSQVSFRTVVPKNLHSSLRLDGEILFTYMTPYHVRVLNGVCWSRDERVSPADLREYFLPHGNSSLGWLPGRFGLLISSRTRALSPFCFCLQLQESSVLATTFSSLSPFSQLFSGNSGSSCGFLGRPCGSFERLRN